jgi:small subunit ribosomal protein S13
LPELIYQITNALKYHLPIYGVGASNVKEIMKAANLDPDKRAKLLTPQEIGRLTKVLERFTVEGKSSTTNSRKYRAPKKNYQLPGFTSHCQSSNRGQSTRVNARTKRGRRMTVGALKKEDAAKLEAAKK